MFFNRLFILCTNGTFKYLPNTNISGWRDVLLSVDFFESLGEAEFIIIAKAWARHVTIGGVVISAKRHDS